jgi:hypothetical protein
MPPDKAADGSDETMRRSCPEGQERLFLLIVSDSFFQVGNVGLSGISPLIRHTTGI